MIPAQVWKEMCAQGGGLAPAQDAGTLGTGHRSGAQLGVQPSHHPPSGRGTEEALGGLEMQDLPACPEDGKAGAGSLTPVAGGWHCSSGPGPVPRHPCG